MSKEKKIVVLSKEKGKAKLEYINDDNITFDKLRLEIDELKRRIDVIVEQIK